ncbi:YerC/YecD family TrpR-related protein [Brevundimonas sp.]|uniref:YerC/YecD family TrpR-related protein n=1 Tax=Brevundimonas sp. TaxID=1871086 RepID=UPI00403462A1
MTDLPSRKSINKAADDRLALYDALLCLKTREEADAFLADLCTPSELRAFAERWAVARLLDQQLQSYREIAVEAGASPTTVVRVARFLKDMDNQGYRLVLDRLKKETPKS